MAELLRSFGGLSGEAAAEQRAAAEIEAAEEAEATAEEQKEDEKSGKFMYMYIVSQLSAHMPNFEGSINQLQYKCMHG